MNIPNRGLIALIILLLATNIGLAVFWHPVPPKHERELPKPVLQHATLPTKHLTTPTASGPTQ